MDIYYVYDSESAMHENPPPPHTPAIHSPQPYIPYCVVPYKWSTKVSDTCDFNLNWKIKSNLA